MHHRLRGGGLRQRVVVQDGTVHVNAAVVPRHLDRPEGGRHRHYLSLALEERGVVALEDTSTVVVSQPQGLAVDRMPDFFRSQRQIILRQLVY